MIELFLLIGEEEKENSNQTLYNLLVHPIAARQFPPEDCCAAS
jgi:hypothetical protein